MKIVGYCLRVWSEEGRSLESAIGMLEDQEEGMVQVVLGELVERHDSKGYARQLIKSTLLEIAKVDHLIEFGASKADSLIIRSTPKLDAKDSVRSKDEPIKGNSYILKVPDKYSKVRLYA